MEELIKQFEGFLRSLWGGLYLLIGAEVLVVIFCWPSRIWTLWSISVLVVVTGFTYMLFDYGHTLFGFLSILVVLQGVVSTIITIYKRKAQGKSLWRFDTTSRP